MKLWLLILLSLNKALLNQKKMQLLSKSDVKFRIFASGLRNGELNVSMHKYNISLMKWIKNMKLLMADAHASSRMD